MLFELISTGLKWRSMLSTTQLPSQSLRITLAAIDGLVYDRDSRPVLHVMDDQRDGSHPPAMDCSFWAHSHNSETIARPTNGTAEGYHLSDSCQAAAFGDQGPQPLSENARHLDAAAYSNAAKAAAMMVSCYAHPRPLKWHQR